MSSSSGQLTADPPAVGAGDAAPAAKPGSKRNVILIAIAVIAGGAGTTYYLTHRGLESTDDAQVDADVVSVPARTAGVISKVLFVDNQPVKAGDVLAEIDPDLAKARLAQAEATLDAAKASANAADADATVATTNAKGNKSYAEASLQGATSSAGATRQQILEGEAAVASAKANRDKAESDFSRASKLKDSGSISEAEYDRFKTTFETAKAAEDQARAHLSVVRAGATTANSGIQEAKARLDQAGDVDALIRQAQARALAAHAQVATAQAARDLAALDLGYTKILAPQDGVVSKKTIGVGQMVQNGQGIVQLVPSQQMWITGNFKETQVQKMKVGQPAHATVDAFPGLTIEGDVESFSAATGARFTLLPPDNATGNFTKVVQRLPVRIHLKNVPPELHIRPGMSVDLTVDTRK